VSQRFGFDFAPWTGEVGVLIEPGRVGSQVAFRRPHLMDSSCHKLPQPHEGMGGEGGGVVVVRRCGVFFGPILEEPKPSSGSSGQVGFLQEVWRGNVRARGGGSV